MTTVSATAAREKLFDLIDQVFLGGEKIGITNKGETKAVLISPEELASWEATLDVMSDEKLVKSIKRGLEDIKKGRTIPWKQVKRELAIK